MSADQSTNYYSSIDAKSLELYPAFKRKPLIIFITGASGSGKTAILKTIEQELQDEISANYFDDIGVPSFDDMIARYGSTEKWQESATHAWIERLTIITDKKLVFLEGSFNPEFALSYMQKVGNCLLILICIHADRLVREERLNKYRNQPELATQDMENFALMLKQKTMELGGVVVDTTGIGIQAAASKVLEIIKKSKFCALQEGDTVMKLSNKLLT